jgi:hypothetical protein
VTNPKPPEQQAHDQFMALDCLKKCAIACAEDLSDENFEALVDAAFTHGRLMVPPRDEVLNENGTIIMQLGDLKMRPNYRRARALALEIDAARIALAEAKQDHTIKPEEIIDLVAEIHDLEHEFFLTGVSSEYEL